MQSECRRQHDGGGVAGGTSATKAAKQKKEETEWRGDGDAEETEAGEGNSQKTEMARRKGGPHP